MVELTALTVFSLSRYLFLSLSVSLSKVLAWHIQAWWLKAIELNITFDSVHTDKV